MPKTRLGKWSMWFIVVFLGLFISTQIIAAIGRAFGGFEPERAPIYQILFPAAVIPAGLSGILAFILGLISVIKFKERSWITYFAILIGFLVLIFALGESLFPHH